MTTKGRIPKEITTARRRRVVVARTIALMVQDLLTKERANLIGAITLAANKEEVLYDQFQLKRLRARVTESFDDLQHQCNEYFKESSK